MRRQQLKAFLILVGYMHLWNREADAFLQNGLIRTHQIPEFRQGPRFAVGPSRRTRLAWRTGYVTTTATTRGRKLWSLRDLVEEISEKSKGPHTVFVGGKGGVGKTTVASALAVNIAAAADLDLKVLVVSTDPAHSLGDALDVDLRKGRGKFIPMTDSLTGGRLFACEVDAGAALEEFRENLAAFDIGRLATALGVSADLLESLGLGEFSGLLNNPPPGLDELVALANVLDNDSVVGEFDVIVVDTAPTGHTVRLLALPKFLDGLLGQLISLRLKLSGLVATLQGFLGSDEANQRKQTIDSAAKRIESFRDKMSRLRGRLQDPESTSFVVVTVPTKLSVAESRRLVTELLSQGIRVSDVVVNQCVGSIDTDYSVIQNYYKQRKAGQDRWIKNLEDTIAMVSSSKEYKSNGNSGPISLTRVPFFDVELVGIPALGYVGSQCFRDNPSFAHVVDHGGEVGAPKVVICGGKGGVGKTTTSCSLAISMAAKGHKVALISTDPAHSLGDAIEMDLSGGELLNCPLLGISPAEGSLSVMEIDASSALGQFKGTVDKLVSGGDESLNGGSGLRNTLRELEAVFETLPAGTDEVVALGKIVHLVKKGGFDRIVLDTAPTGHTLRMLSTPGFLAELIDRLLTIADKVNSNPAVRLLLATSPKAEEIESAAAEAKSKLLSFQLQMYDLEDLFADADRTEFLIVTVPTELAARETIRLLNDLTFEAPDMPVKVRNVVVNQVLGDDGNDFQTFLSHVSRSQKTSIDELKQSISTLSQPPRLTSVPYLDTEPRGVFGLKAVAGELLREEETIEVR